MEIQFSEQLSVGSYLFSCHLNFTVNKFSLKLIGRYLLPRKFCLRLLYNLAFFYDYRGTLPLDPVQSIVS